MKQIFKINKVSVVINYLDKYIESINFDNKELIYSKAPLFVIKLRSKEADKKYISAFEFEFDSFNEGLAKYTHKDVDVLLNIKDRENGLNFNIEVINHTSLLIEQVEIMTLALSPKLIEDGEDAYIAIPYNEGAKITSLKRRDENGFTYKDVDYPSVGINYVYPNMISSPFMAYINSNRGIYLGMHDKDFTPKHIDVREYEGYLRTTMSVFTNINYGENYKMNFDSVMIFFNGDYFDACDIYRDYFYKTHRAEFKTIKEEYNDLPKWYHESPVVVTYPILGGKDSDTNIEPGGLYPYTNGLDIIDHYYELTSSKYMVVLMQWESTAPWAPPYVWPPYGDVDNFNLYRDELHNRGHYLGVYTSGFGWTNKSFRKEYDRADEFNERNLKDIMCTDSNGYMESTVVSDIRFGYDICPALELSKEIFVTEAMKMVDGGLDYVQILDQNHGGNPYFCYSDKHGHVPAPGSWQVVETRKLLNRVDRSKCLLGCESAASEPYLNELKFSDNRYILNYLVGEPIPMYAYLYHEFVNNFMGNQICYAMTDERYSLTFRMAYSFINGDMYTLVIDGNSKIHLAWCNDIIVGEEMPLTLIKNTNHWRIGRFEDFLHLGKMVKPIPYTCNKKTFGFTWGKEHTYVFDAVLSSSYTNGEETYQFFINYDNIEEKISLNLDKVLLIKSPLDEGEEVSGREIIIPPLSLIAIKIK